MIKCFLHKTVRYKKYMITLNKHWLLYSDIMA